MCFCRLFIGSDLCIDDAEGPILSAYKVSDAFFGFSYVVEPNEYFNRVEGSTDPLDLAELTVSIFSDSMDSDAFKILVTQWIVLLREKFRFVTAACEFEDYILEVTGSN